jgi:hypothetical protein
LIDIFIERSNFIVIKTPKKRFRPSSSSPDNKLCIIFWFTLIYITITFLGALESIESILIQTDATVKAGLHSKLLVKYHHKEWIDK